SVHLLERVRDVLEKDETEDDVLVLRGVHRPAQRVGHLPELGFVADGGATRLGCRCVALSLRQVLPHEVIAAGSGEGAHQSCASRAARCEKMESAPSPGISAWTASLQRLGFNPQCRSNSLICSAKVA